MDQILDWALIILFLITLAGSVIYLYATFTKYDEIRLKLRRFYNAIVNIYEKDLELDACFLQLKLNYDKLSQSFPSGDYTSVLDLLETIIYYYDTYSDKEFKRLLKGEKNNDIRAFIMEVCVFIKNDNPFISSPPKEAEMMRTIKDALHNNNTKLGINSLIQLSREVETKEKLLAKKEKENQIATIISVVGIILTLFFGFFSVLPFFTSQ